MIGKKGNKHPYDTASDSCTASPSGLTLKGLWNTAATNKYEVELVDQDLELDWRIEV